MRMTSRLSDDEFHNYLELLASSGCNDVNQLIADFQKGTKIPELVHLDTAQQQQIVDELSKVMQVYESDSA